MERSCAVSRRLCVIPDLASGSVEAILVTVAEHSSLRNRDKMTQREDSLDGSRVSINLAAFVLNKIDKCKISSLIQSKSAWSISM